MKVKKFKWSMKYKHCKKCGRDDRRHWGLGLCEVCSAYERLKKYRARLKENQRCIKCNGDSLRWRNGLCELCAADERFKAHQERLKRKRRERRAKKTAAIGAA